MLFRFCGPELLVTVRQLCKPVCLSCIVSIGLKGTSRNWKHVARTKGIACLQVAEPVYEKADKFKDVPSARWFLSCYVRDVWSRLDNLKASISHIHSCKLWSHQILFNLIYFRFVIIIISVVVVVGFFLFFFFVLLCCLGCYLCFCFLLGTFP